MIGLALAALLGASAGGEPIAATFVEGPARVDGTPLLQGAVLRAGETVETGEGGRVEIAVPGTALIRLGERSRITVFKAVPDHVLRVRLLLGDLWANVEDLPEGESFAVEAGSGVLGARGAEFRARVAPGESDLAHVYAGTLQITARRGGWSRRLGAGDQLRFRRQGGAPARFDPATETAQPFMRWVRSRPMQDGAEPGRIRSAEPRNPEQEHRVRRR